jgi:hypothetical protein
VSSSEAKLNTLSTKTEEFAAESKKLQERAQLAEEEMTRGYNKLKYAPICALMCFVFWKHHAGVCESVYVGGG